jgi:hypothetical protein
VSRNPNQLDLIATGIGGGMYTSWWTAGFDWSGVNNNWYLISTEGEYQPPITRPVLIARNPGQLDVFVIDNNGMVNTCWWPT